MFEAELYFFQVEIELAATDAVVVLEFGLCITPEVLSAVDVLALAGGKALLMVNTVMLEPVKHQPVAGAEAVGLGDTFGDDLAAERAVQQTSSIKKAT